MFAPMGSLSNDTDEQDDQRQGEEDEELHTALRDAVVMLAENEPEDPFGALAAQYVLYSICVYHIMHSQPYTTPSGGNRERNIHVSSIHVLLFAYRNR